jgi:hypothetical protein
MVFVVFRGSGCLITCRYSKRQGENEHPEQLLSSQGFGEESKGDSVSFQPPEVPRSYVPVSRTLASTLLRDQSSQWRHTDSMWMSCEIWIVTNKLRF